MGWRGWNARRDSEALRKGETIRQLHWQCWRPDAPPLETPLADLVEVLPVLIESGSVGLVWPRLWHRAEELGAVGAALAAAYEVQVAHNARVEEDIARVVELLRDHAVEPAPLPVLVKGYAMARLYPSPLVRTAGDIDLVVRDEAYDAAKVALAEMGGRVSFHGDRVASLEADRGAAALSHAADIDLHSLPNWYGGGSPDFFERTEHVEIGGVAVSVPGREEHLRALCLHFLWHGGVRPLRLCDIGLLLDALPESGAGSLDWERSLAGTRAEREYVIVAVRLAERVLGAEIADAPRDVRNYELPCWVEATMLQRWQELARPFPHRRDLLRGPIAAYQVLASRWPDPISAVMRSHSMFGSAPNLQAPARIFTSHWMASARAGLLAQARRIRRFANRLHAL